MRPWALRPPAELCLSSRLFSGVDFVISEKSETVRKRRPGEVGLYFLIATTVLHAIAVPDRDRTADGRLQIADGSHLPSAVCHPGCHDHVESLHHFTPKMSISLPSARVTRARFVSLRLPTLKPLRLRLPLRLMMFTRSTFTAKICSMAIFTSERFVRGSAPNV